MFIPYINREIPRDEVKVLLGDNLAAHLSPYVTSLCKEHNVRYVRYPYRYRTKTIKMISFTYGINVSVPIFDRFIFLPENSTHILQPLDVAVFATMKKRWRAIVTEWKEECSRNGTNYATIPKQVILRTGIVKFTLSTVLYHTIPELVRYLSIY